MGMGSKKKNEAAAASVGEVAGSTEPASTTPAAPPAQEDGDVTLQPVSDPAPETDGDVVHQLHEQDQDAADAAGIGSAHGDSSDALAPLVETVHEHELHPDPEMASLIAEEIELRATLEQLGDPLARRRELDAAIEAEIASFKDQQKAHAQRLGQLRQSKNDEFWPGQKALEEIDNTRAKIEKNKVDQQHRTAAMAEAAALALASTPEAT